MKRLLYAGAVTLSVFLAACGGGAPITPPPPAGGFSNASLMGQYAFLMNGLDTNGAYIARIGSFSADGAGHITAGLEDVLDLGSGAAVRDSMGECIQADSTR